MNVSKLIYNKLISKNVTDVFMYSGGSIMPLIDQFYKGPIKYYVNNHEQNCGHAATGYAKASGKTGISIVTSGPGITNSITPLLDATNDSTPLIVFSGNVALDAIGSNAFQEAPAVEITRPVTKWSYCLDNPSDTEYVINEAFRVANSGKKGSVHIDLPKCILGSQINLNQSMNIDSNFKYTTDVAQLNLNKLHSHKFNTLYDDKYIVDVCNIINKAKRPILYVGQGCNSAYQELRELAAKGNIPVTSTLHAMGVYDEIFPLSLGMCGMHGHAAANYALQEADCIIAVGSRFDDRTTGNVAKYAPRCDNFIHINIEPCEIHKVVKTNYNIVGDSQQVLSKMIPHIKENKISYEVIKDDEYIRDDWLKYNNQNQRDNIFRYTITDNIKTQDVLKVLNSKTLLQKNYNDYYFTSGVGNHQMMSTQYMTWRLPGRFISSGSLGVMGVGLPYAIGAQLAHPDKTIICIDGDSSFMMTSGDLKTVAEHNIPVKILIINNSCQDMVRIWENLFFEGRETATINTKNPEFTKLAEAYGIKSLYCDDKDSLSNVLDEFLSFNGSILLECKTEPDICLPLVPPRSALDEMVLYNPDKPKLGTIGDMTNNTDINSSDCPS
jgi:acetolactate synthase-1/2/3 large subunit